LEQKVYCNTGSLDAMPGDAAARLAAVREAGFDGIESWPPPREQARAWSAGVADAGLEVGCCAYFPEGADAEPVFATAAACGARYLEAQVDGYWRDDGWVVDRTGSLMDLGGQYRVPFLLETHRGRYTQDMRRTLWLVDQLPDLELWGDFSHYTSMGEIKAPWPEDWKRGLFRIAERCGGLHGRLNNGQRVQDPLPMIRPEQLDAYVTLWRHARDAAAARGRPWFVFTTELLAIDYQLTDLSGARLGDLWTETRELHDLVRQRVLAS
jgi:hypothetical protein